MRRRPGRVGITAGAPAGRLTIGALSVALTLALPASALANNRFSIDPNVESTGPIVTEAAGNGYVSWERKIPGSSTPGPTVFCKIPRGGTCTDPQALPRPIAGSESVTTPFPVLGATPGVVYVVLPRYVPDDTLVWTSQDGGEKFSAATVVASYAGGTGVGDVLRNPLSGKAHPTSDQFDVASFNSSVGLSEVGVLEAKPFEFKFEGTVDDGDGQGASLGFTLAGSPVEAYWSDGAIEEVAFDYLSKSPASNEKNWVGPITVADGYQPRLASGPAGLFMLSTDIVISGEQPTQLDVRKYDETTHQFGAPTDVGSILPSVSSLFEGGDIFESESGTLYVVTPLFNGSEGVLVLWESTDGGVSFHGERRIATIGESYGGPPRLAVAADGQGWLTFEDSGGLEVADLNALTPSSPPVVISAPFVPPVAPPTATATTTTQSGDGIDGSSLTVPQGTSVTDQARISGVRAATATGTVTYNLYKDSKCTVAATAGSTASVTGGVAGPSAAVKPGAGSYYWKVTYGGDSTNAGSTSACGSEVLVVALKASNLGLPSVKGCVSKRKFTVHPRAPKGVKLVSVEIQIDGKTVKKGKLSKHETTVNLIGLPKGAFKVALITKSSTGKLYEDIRTYHTCVSRKHKKK